MFLPFLPFFLHHSSTFFIISFSFTEFGNTWLSTGCIADLVIVWPAIVLIDTMLRSKTTNRSFYNELESDIVGGDGTLLCSHRSRQVFTPNFFIYSIFGFGCLYLSCQNVYACHMHFGVRLCLIRTLLRSANALAKFHFLTS